MLNGHLKKDDAATQQRCHPGIAAASLLLGPAREHDMMVAYVATNHRAESATSAATIRDAESSMRPNEVGQPAQYRPIVSGGTWPSKSIHRTASADR